MSDKEKRPDIYLSITTLPERLISDHFKKVYKSFEKQTIPFTKLVINLSVDEFTYVIPEYLKKNKKVILNETKICGPCAKLLGSIRIIPPEALTIVLDDDNIIKETFIKSLYTSYLLNPNKVTSHVIKKREKWTDVYGFCGFIYKTKLLKDIGKFYATQPKCCVKIDDTWLGWCIKKLGIDVVQAQEKNARYTMIDDKASKIHPKWVELWRDTKRKELTKEALIILEARM
uniref:Glycosyltransferase n=1 Tax=viral metagenome TaxID=1070528 RepID=A0A6C0BBG5_9ZZZZ